MPGYRYYCKSDDDTLVHLDHLTALVDELQRALPADKPVYLGHTKWRGWDMDDRFQACGGGWGAAKKTTNDLRHSADCPHAAGPYPYMSGDPNPNPNPDPNPDPRRPRVHVARPRAARCGGRRLRPLPRGGEGQG